MMIDHLGVSHSKAGILILFAIIGYIVATLIFGYLADFVKKIYLVFSGCLGIFSMSLPFIYSFEHASQAMVFLTCSLIGIFVGMMQGTLSPYVSSSFPTHIRATSVSCCYNFSSAIFGGSAPVISMWLVRTYGSPIYVAFFLMAVCSVSMLSMLYMIFISRNRNNAARAE